jgi:tRNA(Ile)-lysidine synthase TilS/MesJ
MNIASFSGGKDSTAMLLMLLEMGITERFRFGEMFVGFQ